MNEFRTLSGETYRGFELTHDSMLSVPEVLKQLRFELRDAGVEYGYIVSLSTACHRDDDALFVTTLIVGG